MAGFLGGPALAADVAACMTLSVRTVQSRGLVYGFDPSDRQELAFVLHVLDAASRLGPNGKRLARGATSGIGAGVAQRRLVRPAIERLLERMPVTVTARLAVLKSESVVSVLGALTSAGFNGWYLQEVTRTAQMAYRERFLRRTYGDELLTAYGV